MNKNKFWIVVAVIFVLFEVTNYLIHGVFLDPIYQSEEVQKIFRPMDEMQSNMWILWITDLVWVFFFTLIFVKGYENKGIMEGVKYGVYIGLFFSFVYAYQSYWSYPIPYSLTLQWFLFGMIQSIIFGAVAAIIYKPKTEQPA